MPTHTESAIYEFDNFRIDSGKRLFSNGGPEPIPLTPKIVDTLLYLVSRHGTVIDKDELMSAIWPDSIVEENNLNKNISVLRHVLGENPGDNRYIVTVPGKGYKFVADVRVTASDKIQETLNNSLPDIAQENKHPTFWFVFAGAAVLISALTGLFVLSWQNDPIGDHVPRSIAVLPFKPLAADGRDEFLEIGMADALIARLSERREIEMRPLASVRTLVNAGKDTVAIGRALGADAVLEGGVQRLNDKIHVNARLVNVADGSSPWTQTFDGNYREMLAEGGLIDRLTTAIAFRLANNADTAPFAHRNENVEAWEYYLKGSYQVGQITPEKIQESIEYFQTAVDRDPNYALAYAGLSRAYISLAPSSDYPPTECFPKAKAMAQKALEIDERLAEGHSALGSILFWYEWDWSGAEEECKHAVQLNPNSPDAHYTYAHLLSNIGRHGEALAEMKRARALDPINLRINALESLFLHYAGQTDEAFDRLHKIAELNPNFWLGHFLLSKIYIEKGMYAEAITEAELAQTFSGASNYPAALKGYALAKSGKKAEARAIIDELSSRSNERFVPSYYFALIYNGLGDTDKAISWLERGLEQRDTMMVFLKVEPKWNNVRSDPRFVEILKQMRFE